MSFLFSSSSGSYSYKGKHVMITGGSSGIGLEIAKECIRVGASVITLVARDSKKLEKAKTELLEMIASEEQTKEIICKTKLCTVSVDVGKSQSEVDTALQPCYDSMGSVDVLINCAGTSIAFEFDDPKWDSSEFDRMIRVNTLGSIYPTRSVLMKGGMKAQAKANNGARIVFVSSQIAQCAIHGYTAYAASKWAIRGLAEALQMELKAHGVYVSVSYPPDTDTPGYQVEMETKPEITKLLSESGSVFDSVTVARDIVTYSEKGYFGISTGLDGWALKQGHAGMSPINHWWEFVQQILFASITRIIALFVLTGWDYQIYGIVKKKKEKDAKD